MIYPVLLLIFLISNSHESLFALLVVALICWSLLVFPCSEINSMILHDKVYMQKHIVWAMKIIKMACGFHYWSQTWLIFKGIKNNRPEIVLVNTIDLNTYTQLLDNFRTNFTQIFSVFLNFC